jgi:hypothetical protein
MVVAAEQINPYQIVPVPPQYVPAIWEEAAPILQQALDRGNGEIWPEDIYERLLDARMQMVAVFEGETMIGVVVTQVIQYPRKMAVRVEYLAGSHMPEWLDNLVQILDTRAEDLGVDWIEMRGRKGWAKYLAPYARTTHILCVRKTNG